MECILEAHPVPDITWYQGQKPIADSKRVKMSRKATGKDTYLLTLEISNPTKADGGNYRCNAFNNFGESNANISLNFQGKSPSMQERSGSRWFLLPPFSFIFLIYTPSRRTMQSFETLYTFFIFIFRNRQRDQREAPSSLVLPSPDTFFSIVIVRNCPREGNAVFPRGFTNRARNTS